MKGKKASDIYHKFQKQYVQQCLKHDIVGQVIKVRCYHPTKKDIDQGVIDLPYESIDTYHDLFKIESKEQHIIEKICSFEGFLLVHVMESFIDEELGKDKMILRTLRIYDLDNHYQLLDTILLEQIKAYTFNAQI